MGNHRQRPHPPRRTGRGWDVRIPAISARDLRAQDTSLRRIPVCFKDGKLCLVLPVPPTVNNLYVTGRDGKRHKSKEARDYANRVRDGLALQRITIFKGTVGVRVRVFRGRKVGDIDNFKKALYDSLKGYCWKDDKQIVYEEAFRYDDKQKPRVEVEIWELTTRDLDAFLGE
jgi:Holliday junction resolvase RusA-like endonuclease